MKALKFNEQMEQAVKDGLKTQTRRPMKPQPIEESTGYFTWFSEWGLCLDTSFDNLFQQILENEYGPYKTGDTHDVDGTQIKITSIRVELLQDISEEDAMAEGAEAITERVCLGWNGVDDMDYDEVVELSAVDYFKVNIWNKLPYQPPYDWNSNPWVWVIEFEKVD